MQVVIDADFWKDALPANVRIVVEALCEQIQQPLIEELEEVKKDRDREAMRIANERMDEERKRHNALVKNLQQQIKACHTRIKNLSGRNF